MEVHLKVLSPTSGDLPIPHPRAKVDAIIMELLLESGYRFAGAMVKICGDHIAIWIGDKNRGDDQKSTTGVLVIINWVSGKEIMVSI